MGKKRYFTPEFKQDAVDYYQSSGKTKTEVARELKVGLTTLHEWIAKAEKNNGAVVHRGSGNYSTDAEKEIARLKKELRDHKDALEILKKAIGILNK
ncbi:transposase [Clostridium sp. 'deep sea']|uniref:transposase n=1 Tax=Clostridium sp. 'deep sea' TaxID=2779445 RepID=UPI001896A201|nr:transposase [Clostridium sp. 'deep sea']QOR35195.1 transposase [Clostridium sp. 'deep sea']QOR36859.1 transposase [Clostridium sp. 'deep sea']